MSAAACLDALTELASQAGIDAARQRVDRDLAGRASTDPAPTGAAVVPRMAPPNSEPPAAAYQPQHHNGCPNHATPVPNCIACDRICLQRTCLLLLRLPRRYHCPAPVAQLALGVRVGAGLDGSIGSQLV